MEKYYVQVVDGVPCGFLISETNLHHLLYAPNQLIGHPTFYEVSLSDRPNYQPSDYKVVDIQPTYTISDGIVVQTWGVRDMSLEEQQAVNDEILQTKTNYINGLIQQAQDTLQNPKATTEIKQTLNNYIANLNELLSNTASTLLDVKEIKICPDCLLN